MTKMTTQDPIKKAIQLSIEGGYKDNGLFEAGYLDRIFLTPSFWQSLGKALGWGQKLYRTETGEEWGKRICLHCDYDCSYQPSKLTGCNHVHYPEACSVCSKKGTTWQEYWHNFIDHLASGKSPSSFFESILTEK